MAPLAQWQTALAGVASNRADVLILGDSITEGAYAIPQESECYAGLVRSALQAAYGGVGAGLYPMKSQMFTRYTVTGGSHSTGTAGPGSYCRRFATLSNYITATVEGDTLMIGYNQSANTGDFTYTVDGGAPVTVTVSSGSNASLLHRASMGSGGTHTVVVYGSTVATKQTDLWSIGACTANAGVQVHQFGFSGVGTAANTNGTNALDFLTSLAPKLVILCMDANDYGGQTSLVSYEANMDSVFTKCKAAGADILVITAPVRQGSLTIPSADYRAVMQSLSVTHDAYFINLATEWGTYTESNNKGLMYDTTHPTTLGHRLMANLILPQLTPVLPGTFLTEYGVNFRSTLAYATDGAAQYHSYVDNTEDPYPIYKSGNRVGWNINGSTINTVNRVSGGDPRLAGVASMGHSDPPNQYRMEVLPGTYEIRLAGGDTGGGFVKFYCQIRDGATVLATIGGGASVPDGQYMDATGVVRTSAAAWVSGNAALTATVAGTVLTFDFGNPGGLTGANRIAHIGLRRLLSIAAISSGHSLRSLNR